MAATGKPSPYFMYFPTDYRWSAAIVNMIGSGTYGNSDIGEIHQIGRMLQDKVGDDNAWFDACVKVADRVRAHAEERAASGHKVTAAGFYRRACMLYQMAERFRTPKDAAGLAIFRLSVDCFKRFAELQADLRIEPVEVPFEKGSLPGYFVHAKNTSNPRPPCVVFFNGLDVNKELQFSRGVDDLVKRGLSCLVMDGPGTGEAIRFRNYYLRHDYEVAGSACIDYLEKRADVNAKRIGVMAISLGGYYAPRAAAFEQRFACAIAWGAQWDYWEVWKSRFDRLDSGKTPSLSVPWQHLLWIFNVTTREAAMKCLEGFRLDGVVQKITCPFLLVHGAGDEQISLAIAQKCFDAVGSKQKTLKVFSREEGGYHHCQIDNVSIGVAYMRDWVEGVLKP